MVEKLPRDAPLIDLLKMYIDTFDKTGSDVFQQVVNVNKLLIELIDYFLEHAIHLEQGSFGVSLMIYTFIIKLFIFPLYEEQLRSNARMTKIEPSVRYLQSKYAGQENKEKMNEEMAMLYTREKINPLAVVAPFFVQLPIFVSLYKAIVQLDKEDVHFTDKFLWIPNMSGPMYDQGAGLGWLTTVGQEDNYLYLIMPILLVATQVTIQRISMPENKSESFASKLVEFLPVLSGLTALSSPAGLSVYWMTNTILSYGQSLLVKAKLKDEGLDMT
jgi:YidC/Oxa1 family membrane protein insertase